MEQEDFSRRDFVALTVAAGIAAAAGTTADAQQQLSERNVEIKTADGTCDAAFIHPPTGRHAGVIIWPDAFGLRPSMRDLAGVADPASLVGEPLTLTLEDGRAIAVRLADVGGRILVEGHGPGRCSCC